MVCAGVLSLPMTPVPTVLSQEHGDLFGIFSEQSLEIVSSAEWRSEDAAADLFSQDTEDTVRSSAFPKIQEPREPVVRQGTYSLLAVRLFPPPGSSSTCKLNCTT